VVRVATDWRSFLELLACTHAPPNNRASLPRVFKLATISGGFKTARLNATDWVTKARLHGSILFRRGLNAFELANPKWDANYASVNPTALTTPRAQRDIFMTNAFLSVDYKALGHRYVRALRILC